MKHKKSIKENIIGLSLGYFGIAIFTWWGIWSYANYGMPFCMMFTFVRTIGGIIGV